ncbi:splicing factor Cactin isoform X2 [Neocloeon triangulifer]|uniref:splicing factor Cactin isoform X2 n=1 Tax=Neocloeon triangulifer TaxID=2078957 RepID=UPI00286EF2E0|nr:splicing factor Cactin isoform X2 [Neocloeon triangulifer]
MDTSRRYKHDLDNKKSSKNERDVDKRRNHSPTRSKQERSRRRSRSSSDSEREKRKKDKKSQRSSSKSSKKKKEKRKRRRISSSSSSSSQSSAASTNNGKLMKKLEVQRLMTLEERKRHKELVKATETPEEKRLRRLLKKENKERKRKERMGWDNDYLHYTNTDNPFGDANLLSTFVWKKKLDKAGLSGASREQLEVVNRSKQEENKRELEKVKKRRQERELERQQREDEMQLIQRQKEAAQFQEWERQEDQFHFEQARLRSKIRIQDGRAKPIDLLAKYVQSEDDVDAVEMHEPYAYLNGLTIKDLEDLIEDIKVYREIERGQNSEFWSDITVIVQDELHKLSKLEGSAENELIGRREGIHQSVAKEVASIFKGKTAAQLAAIQVQIESTINKKAEGVDIGYWESLLSQLKAHMARARLRDRHQANLRKKLQILKEQQEVKEEPEDDYEEPSTSTSAQIEVPEDQSEDSKAADNEAEEEASGETAEGQEADQMLNDAFAQYERGSYSPKYLGPAALDAGTVVIAEEDDEQRLQFARQKLLGKGSVKVEEISAEERALQKEARIGMTNEEVQFSVESTLEKEVYLWSDKYRPRKPRYFNRVHTGFEWNKYNQTHYDMDNPPPKIVQGYKFNIFYPDLIDKNATPQYFLTPCGDNRDFAILRFHAGPPYEDIAFKIVNREWEYSYKRGFRCQFHNNIFQLWFHFKRYRYRR